MAKTFEAKYFNGSFADTYGRTIASNNTILNKAEKGYSVRSIDEYQEVMYGTSILPSSAFSAVAFVRSTPGKVLGTGLNYNAIFSDVEAGGAANFVFMYTYGGAKVPILLTNSGLNYRYFTPIPDPKSWHCVILTINGNQQTDISNAALYVDNVVSPSAATGATSPQASRLNVKYVATTRDTNTGIDIAYLAVHDTVLTDTERAEYQSMFESLKPISKPKRGFILDKPTDLSRFKGTGVNQGLVAAYNFKPNGNVLTDISGNNRPIALVGTKVITNNGLYFTKNDGLCTVANMPSLSVWTISCRLRNNYGTYGNYFGTLGGTSHGVIFHTASGWNYFYSGGTSYQSFNIPAISKNIFSTFTFVSNGTTVSAYFNGVFISSVTPTDTIINPTAFNQFGGGSSSVEWVDLRMHNRILSLQEIKDYANSFVSVYYANDFSDYAVGETI